jgi:hypothetical protein
MNRTLLLLGRLAWLCLVLATDSFGAELRFHHHFINRELPISERGTGDYGLTALADLDRDGDLDFVLGGRGVKPDRLYWFEFRNATNWIQHVVGTNYQSDVGLAALDIDGDGWTDLVCSGVWYRNTGRPSEPFQRILFATNAAGAHDILAADMDGDGRRDLVMMGDERTTLKALCWFEIPADPKQLWTRHHIGPPVHGAITPNGVADLDADGDLDVVRANAWFENQDAKGRNWIAHTNIPFGRVGPFGKCVRTAIVDLDGDGKNEIVMGDADITDCRVAILRNEDGKGLRWSKQELPHSFTYGSLHALAVADLNGDGRPDIAANEQEELLPPGRENPRWVVWENLGQGRFAERIVLDQKLGGHELQLGDVDGDGDIDICSKPWGVRAWNGNGGKMHVDFLENLLRKSQR